MKQLAHAWHNNYNLCLKNLVIYSSNSCFYQRCSSNYLVSMVATLHSIIDCELLNLPRYMNAFVLVMCCLKHADIS